ncbi:MAG TPA: SRPBCC family protein [Nitrospirales bacterium]|nr:SRPBCC family protein [Nitrospirales bacterium]
MSTIEKSIEVHVPVKTAYNQWTQFEDFPKFMEGVKSVKQLDDKRLHWKAEIAGQAREWDAEIYDQIPDQRIAWRSIGGVKNAGVVMFDKVANDRTRVRVSMEYEPHGAAENVGDTLGIVSQRVQGDLERFKSFIEKRGQETGAWRGEIHSGAAR